MESANQVWTALVELTYGEYPVLKIDVALLDDLFAQAKRSMNSEYEFDMLNELLQHHLTLFPQVSNVDLLTSVISKKWNLT